MRVRKEGVARGIPRRSFKAADVVAVLENIIAETGTAPTYVRCDNDPEFTAAALIDWCNNAERRSLNPIPEMVGLA
jgi:hypothetical protein